MSPLFSIQDAGCTKRLKYAAALFIRVRTTLLFSCFMESLAAREKKGRDMSFSYASRTGTSRQQFIKCALKESKPTTLKKHKRSKKKKKSCRAALLVSSSKGLVQWEHTSCCRSGSAESAIGRQLLLTKVNISQTFLRFSPEDDNKCNMKTLPQIAVTLPGK